MEIGIGGSGARKVADDPSFFRVARRPLGCAWCWNTTDGRIVGAFGHPDEQQFRAVLKALA
jgi:hypothetical protein